jgi:hypothetical protein
MGRVASTSNLFNGILLSSNICSVYLLDWLVVVFPEPYTQHLGRERVAAIDLFLS